MIKPKTPEGEATLKLFGLNSREDLQEAHANAFDDAEAIFERYFDAIKAKSPDREKRSAKRINRMMAGKEPYSAMQRLAITSAIEHWLKRNIPITLPLSEVG